MLQFYFIDSLCSIRPLKLRRLFQTFTISSTFNFSLRSQEVPLPPAAVRRRGRLALREAGCLHSSLPARRETPAGDAALGNSQDAAAPGGVVPHSGGGQRPAEPRGGGGGERDGGGERGGVCCWKRLRPYEDIYRHMTDVFKARCVCVLCARVIDRDDCFANRVGNRGLIPFVKTQKQ